MTTASEMTVRVKNAQKVYRTELRPAATEGVRMDLLILGEVLVEVLNRLETLEARLPPES